MHQAVSPLAETFVRDSCDEGVLVADGYGIRVFVNRGHLVIEDGIGRHRRVRRFARATHGLRRVVVLGHTGFATLEAHRWMSAVGISYAQIDTDGQVLCVSGAPGRDDVRLRRQQALAATSPTGLAIARHLLRTKVAGQANVARRRLGAGSEADAIDELAAALVDTMSIDEARQLEAAAANVYWSAWERVVTLQFVRRDANRVPDHWLRFEGRRSAAYPATARNATDPLNAMTNLGYRLLEVEGRLAALALGLDPALGIVHADLAGRDSFVLDLIEAGRPAIDDHVARLAAEHVFRSADFTERGDGVVRVLAPLSHRLAEASLPLAARTLAPAVEHVAGLLAKASPYPVDVPSVLTGARRRSAAAAKAAKIGRGSSRRSAPVALNADGSPPRAKRRQQPKVTAQVRLPLPVCVVCGSKLPEPDDRAAPRRRHCERCLAERRDEIGRNLPAASRDAAARFTQLAGERPTHTADAHTARARANAQSRREQRDFENAAVDERPDAEQFRREVLPALADLTLTAIAKATGASTSAASKWRAGRRLPHGRHWEALRRLAAAPAVVEEGPR